MILISVLYQNASTSRILRPSPQGLISSIFKPFSPAEFDKNKVLLVLPEFWFTVLAGLEVAVPVPGRPVQHMSAELRLCDDAAEQ